MAFTLIDIFRKPFDPSEYQDHYREALAQVIEAKLEGKEMGKSSRRPGRPGCSTWLTRSSGAWRRPGRARPSPRPVPARAAGPDPPADPEGWMSPVRAEVGERARAAGEAARPA